MSMNQEILSWLPALRRAGFFAAHAALSDEQLLEALEAQRTKEFTAIFEEHYEPEPISDEAELVAMDKTRTVAIDLEADVYEENHVYVQVLKLFAAASGGQFQPTNIEEEWESDGGPISVSFEHQGRQLLFEPEFQDEWLSTEVFEVVSAEMEKSGRARFMVLLGKEGEGYGQMAVFLRLTPEEQLILETELGWKFEKE